MCETCSKKFEENEPTAQELNREYWANYSISNPNE
jgi:hypothetical protein